MPVANLGCIGRVGQLRGYVEIETIHDIALFVAHFHFERAARLDEVLFKHIIQGRVELLAHILNQQRASERQAVLQV